MSYSNDPKNTQASRSGDLVIELFKDPRTAEQVYRDLLNKGYDKDHITIIISKETEERYFLNEDVSTTDLGNKSLQGMGVGGAIGGTVGAVTAGIAALGTSLIIPGLGIIVAGALAAGLAGGGAGALTGGLIGALIGLGISDEQAKEFETGVKEGGVVIGVYTKSKEDYNLLTLKWKTYQREGVAL